MVRLIPIVLALVSLSFHEARATTPTAELRAFFADAALILTDPETEGKYAERLGAIRGITRQVFDAREAAKLSLGPAWSDRSEAERDEFAQLYGDFLERAFIAWIAARVQIAGGPRVTFLGESVGGGQATVRTTVLGRNGRDLPLDYRMVERGDRWAVRDVVVDGVSLAANYRAQFARIIQRSSYRALVSQLRDKAAPAPAVLASAEPPAADAPANRDKPAHAGPSGETMIGKGRLRTLASAFPAAGISQPRPYWVQVAAFKSVEAAVRLASLLRWETPAMPDRAVVLELGPALARVRVGPFADRAEATSNLRGLESRGFKPFIAKEGRDSR